MTPTADDYASIIATFPKNARGRRHLESMCRERRLEQLRREIAEAKALPQWDVEFFAELDREIGRDG